MWDHKAQEDTFLGNGTHSRCPPQTRYHKNSAGSSTDPQLEKWEGGGLLLLTSVDIRRLINKAVWEFTCKGSSKGPPMGMEPPDDNNLRGGTILQGISKQPLLALVHTTETQSRCIPDVFLHVHLHVFCMCFIKCCSVFFPLIFYFFASTTVYWLLLLEAGTHWYPKNQWLFSAFRFSNNNESPLLSAGFAAESRM